MNEKAFTRKIREYLDFGTGRLERKAVLGLQKARGKALSRVEAREPAVGFAWAGHGVARFVELPHFGARFWVLIGALILALLAFTYWQQQENGNGDAGDIDTLLLADELPPHAYIDTRFEAWLKRSQD
ncbi:MAG: DUF3619 family protein [Betaproteobacteria bacterium]|nr:DUF3619 family protein [Betaproteobacteria bacterium]